MNKKQIAQILSAPAPHWVGDGFPVRTVLSYFELGERISPFLIMDYARPREFAPTRGRAGVGEHPHKGFETVTIVYQGELEHADSGGNRGIIGPGDTQWMTAASGVVHEEFHSRDFAQNGGTLEMVQLWVNLPAKFKKEPSGYQTLLSAAISTVALADGAGSVRVIAGEFGGEKGPGQTFTPINLWDVRLTADHHTEWILPSGYTTMLLVLSGEIVVNGQGVAGEAQLVLFERDGQSIRLEARSDATVLLLNGEPIDEPVAWQGPFVMNTQQELRQAITDYQSGRMGRLATTP